MSTFLFGSPNLFAMPVVDQTMYDPKTGNVVGYDKVGNDVAINYTFDLMELTGNLGNQVVGLIPHTTRLTGTYNSQAFSLEHRALLSGGTVSNNGIAPVCETITATGASLTVQGTPVKSYEQPASDTLGWCQVREHGADTYLGTNYGINLSSKTVQNFVAVSGKQYDVFYFTDWTSAKVVNLPKNANPSIVSIHQKWGIYSNENGTAGNGTLAGYLYVIVPKAMLEGDAGASGNPTTNARTDYNWRAISDYDNMPDVDACASDGESLGYYVYVPCGSADSNIADLAIIGGGVSVAKNGSAQVPVVYIMKDGSTAVPHYADLKFTMTTSATGVSVGEHTGVVTATGSATGSGEITVTRTIGSKTITTYCNVVVA